MTPETPGKQPKRVKSVAEMKVERQNFKEMIQTLPHLLLEGRNPFVLCKAAEGWAERYYDLGWQIERAKTAN